MTEASIKQINNSKTLSSDEINSLCKNIVTRSDAISNGIVLTPSILADMVVSRCDKYLQQTKIETAGDFCSGMGVFINALNKQFPYTKTLSFEKNSAMYKSSSGFYKSSQNKIICLDTLFDTDKYDNTFNLIVGNPPYVRVQNIPSDLKTRLEADNRYAPYLEGSYDLSVAFIAKAISLLKENGVCGLILPRKILSSSYGEKICKYLSSNARILEIIDFCDNQLFADKTTYISVLIFQKTVPCQNYSFTYYKLPTSKKANLSEITKLSEENKHIYESSLLYNFPWEFKNKNERVFLELIQGKSIPLTSVFNVVQGFRTGNNKAFLINDALDNGPNIRAYIDGTNIKRGYLSNTKRIIWPYYRKPNKVELISEKILSDNNPLAYFKLKNSLDTSKSPNWYAYSRPQNLMAMYSPKIFIKEMMPRAEFAADTDGSICFSSGYALIPKNKMTKKELLIWSFILSTDIMEYQYRCIASNLHSGWFRLYKNHTLNIRLPDKSLLHDTGLLQVAEELISDTESSELWEKLNGVVSNFFNLPYEVSVNIKNELKLKHQISMPNESKATSEGSIMNISKYTDKLSDTAYPELSIEDRKKYLPVELTCYNHLHEERPEYRTLVTYQKDKSYPIQRWYKYTQGYSIALVKQLLSEFGATEHDTILDPFCGGGTTLLVAKKHNINSVGIDVSPLSCWISAIKTHSWSIENVQNIRNALTTLSHGYDYNFDRLQFKSFLLKAFYPNVLAQTLYIQNWINSTNLLALEKDFLLLSLVSIQEEVSMLRKHGSHYRFLNDYSHVGVNKLNIKLIEEDADISKIFKEKALNMLEDISAISDNVSKSDVNIFCADIRDFKEEIPKASIVITSPPYLNRNNYFSQQKVELSLLNLISSNSEYKDLVKKSFCSHVDAELPNKPVSIVPEVNTIIDAVLKQKSNNVKIPNMIAGYFNDLNNFFEALPRHLTRKAKVAFVVADCRWNGVVVPLDHLVCRIAENHGFQAKKIIVARMKGNSPQQMKEFGKIPVRESIVILENR